MSIFPPPLLPPLPAAARKVRAEGRRDVLAAEMIAAVVEALMDYCQGSTTPARVMLRSTAMAATVLDLWETARVILRPAGISTLLMMAMAATAMVAAVLAELDTARVILRPAGTSKYHIIAIAFCSNQADLARMALMARLMVCFLRRRCKGPGVQ